MTPVGPLIATRLRRLWLVLSLCAAVGPVLGEPLRLDERPAVDVWPAISVLADPDSAYAVEQLVAQGQLFAAPIGTARNLGRRSGTIWLRVPVVVPAGKDVHRVLEIDYPALNEIDLYVSQDAHVQSHYRMGNQMLESDRALPTRTHAAPLVLSPGAYELLLRVRTLSSVVLPITIRTLDSFTRYESRVQLVQGITIGLALCMLLYSLAHWVSLRDPVFLDYALLVVGNMVFSLAYFGIGAEYLWANWPRVSMQIAPMTVMVAAAAGTRFIRSALAVRTISRSIDAVLRLAGLAAVLGLVATPLGLIEYRSAQTLATVLGIVVTVAVLPVAAARAWRGERVAIYMLFGWAFYSVGAITLAGILRGLVEPTYWSQHVYPFSTIIEMSAWMAVLGLRVQAIRRDADRANVESRILRTMAHTDALTGLLNRRGLNNHLDAALRSVGQDRMLAVYLLDLDAFKPVNDRFGHDVGDALLVEVGHRLQAQVRGHDVVARLGGDEFVVLASGLSDEVAAHALGQKLLCSFEQPFEAGDGSCHVGLTIGYALAPLDGNSADELLKRADAAMYVGKQQQGRHRVQRLGHWIVGASSVAG